MIQPRTAVIVEACQEWLGLSVHHPRVRGIIQAYQADIRSSGPYDRVAWCAVLAMHLVHQHEPAFAMRGKAPGSPTGLIRWEYGSASALRAWAEGDGRCWLPVGAAPPGSILVRDGHVGILLTHRPDLGDGWADSIDGNVGPRATSRVALQTGEWDGALAWG